MKKMNICSTSWFELENKFLNDKEVYTLREYIAENSINIYKEEIFEINIEKAVQILKKQLNTLYYLSEEDIWKIQLELPQVRRHLWYCFSHIKNKYYLDDSGTVNFNPLHTCQYTMFLYIMSNSLFRQDNNNNNLCDRIYCLSKVISSADLYYEINLPDVFFFDHPVGAVMGRADYGNFFSFSQGCTVGNNLGKYPKFGEYVIMMSDAKVIGDCKIGNHVVLSANSYIKDTNIPDYSLVFGHSPNLVLKPITQSKYEELDSFFR